MFGRLYREPDWSDVFEKFLAGLFAWPLEAWLLMLTFGMMHHDVFDWVPSLGFKQCFILSLFLGVLGMATVPTNEIWMLRRGFKKASESI